jgi:hypothetical protein
VLRRRRATRLRQVDRLTSARTALGERFRERAASLRCQPLLPHFQPAMKADVRTRATRTLRRKVKAYGRIYLLLERGEEGTGS